jgi:hypothetical protein
MLGKDEIKAMTNDERHIRDEHRAKCFEAMECAWPASVRVPPREALIAAFDALHGIARVNPIEATEEMVKAGRFADTNEGYYFSELWRAMSITGDLTDPPEGKS